MWTWLSANSGPLSVVVAVMIPAVAGLWVLAQFVANRAADAAQKRFENYHRLIKDLVAPDPAGSGPYLDRQVAVVYELRHFKRYRKVTVRILRGLRATWAKTYPPDNRLLKEIDLTLEYLSKEHWLVSALPFISSAVAMSALATAIWELARHFGLGLE